MDRAIGTGEAALATATGATGGALGMIGGTLKGLAEQILSGNFGTAEAAKLVEQSAQSGAQALTYAPRTPSGQSQTQAVGEVMQNLIPVAPILPGVAPAAAGARNAAPAGVVARAGAEGLGRAVAGEAGASAVASGIDAGSRVAQLAASKATTLPRRALEAITRDDSRPTPGTRGSVNAAATDMATQRRATAETLGFTGDTALTRGQATRDPAQLKFERETAKMPDAGNLLRERTNAQNNHILTVLEGGVDETGAQAPTLRATGIAVDKALVEQVKRDKAQMRVAYKNAEKAGEMRAPVSLVSMVDYLNEAAPEAATAPLLTTARNLAVRLGIAEEQGGRLVPSAARPADSLMNRPAVSGVTLKSAETFRQAINRNTDMEPTNIRQATIIKGLIDEATEGAGGDLYRQARALRQRFAQNYEDRASIAKLLNTKKGMADRQVALEDVFSHSILRGSLDDVRNTRRVLHRSGPEGQQAWKELQGATVRHIRDEATGNVATDAAGNRVVSPAKLDKAIRELDADGRLDFVFGKQGAQKMRDINDLAQYTLTVPPEAGVNLSNTAATMLSAFADAGMVGMSGLPVPVASISRLALNHIKDAKLRRRISDALNDTQSKPPRAPGPAPTAPPAPQPTLH
ncbi:hypothetical protein ASF44_16385 [Pseudorhodoferax sp. Leaf274]|nr:hypothetical protein ASF44_16385 [Pseudorhodoferax sp. Leaf274]